MWINNPTLCAASLNTIFSIVLILKKCELYLIHLILEKWIKKFIQLEVVKIQPWVWSYNMLPVSYKDLAIAITGSLYYNFEFK